MHPIAVYLYCFLMGLVYLFLLGRILHNFIEEG